MSRTDPGLPPSPSWPARATVVPLVAFCLLILVLVVGCGQTDGLPSLQNDPAGFVRALSVQVDGTLDEGSHHGVRVERIDPDPATARARVHLSDDRTVVVAPDPVDQRPWVWVEWPSSNEGWDAAVRWQRAIDQQLAQDRSAPPSAGDVGTRSVALDSGPVMLTRPEAHTVILRFPLGMLNTVLDEFPDSVSARPPQGPY